LTGYHGTHFSAAISFPLEDRLFCLSTVSIVCRLTRLFQPDAADGAMGLTHGRYPDRPRSKRVLRAALPLGKRWKLRASNSSMRTAVGPANLKAHHGRCLIDGEFTAPLLPARKALSSHSSTSKSFFYCFFVNATLRP
jgi:hypothetical protein